MSVWDLPECIEISGIEYSINTDYRDILDILYRLNDGGQDEYIRVYVALALFYNNFDRMPPGCYEEAVTKMYDFIRCGEPESCGRSPKVIDWEQDANMIIADVNKVAGCEIRSLSFCHWWTFIAWFNAIGDGQLATVVSIREKRRKGKKLTDWERDFYHSNRDKVDFKTKYTPEEDKLLKQMLGGQ